MNEMELIEPKWRRITKPLKTHRQHFKTTRRDKRSDGNEKKIKNGKILEKINNNKETAAKSNWIAVFRKRNEYAWKGKKSRRCTMYTQCVKYIRWSARLFFHSFMCEIRYELFLVFWFLSSLFSIHRRANSSISIRNNINNSTQNKKITLNSVICVSLSVSSFKSQAHNQVLWIFMRSIENMFCFRIMALHRAFSINDTNTYSILFVVVVVGVFSHLYVCAKDLFIVHTFDFVQCSIRLFFPQKVIRKIVNLWIRIFILFWFIGSVEFTNIW